MATRVHPLDELVAATPGCAPSPADGAEPVRVLFVYDHLGYPHGATHGLTRYCINTLPRLNRGPVALTACFLREPHPAAAILRERGVAPIFLNRAKWDPRALLDVIKLIRRHQIDIVHAVGQKGILVGRTAARLTGCGALIHLRDIYPLPPLLRAAFRSTAHWTDLALGVSSAVCRYAVQQYGLAPHRTRLLYNGISLAEFAPPERARTDAWRVRTRLPPDATLIGVVGRLAPEKGHARLLRQMPRILERVPGAVLVVVGDGPLRAALEQLTARWRLAHAVRFVGQQDDAAAVLGALDVVAIPSDHEGLCHVALEALAVGRPVVATDVGGLPEALNGGEHGILVPLGDDDALGDAIVRVLQDRTCAGRLLRTARHHLERFSIERHVARQHEIYLELARTVRSRRGRRRRPAPDGAAT